MANKDPLEREIIEAIATGLRINHACSKNIVGLDRKDYDFRSSYHLQQLTVSFDDGSQLPMLLKDLSAKNVPPEIARARPDFLYCAEREIGVYSEFLSNVMLDTAQLYATAVDYDLGRFWLFIEKVAGRELYQFGELEIWQAAARWLARFQRECANFSLDYNALKPLVWDGVNFTRLFEIAQVQLADGESFGSGALERFRPVADTFRAAIDTLVASSQTLVHGEFYASNILVRDRSGNICPIDWETAGWGSRLIDLAALISGNWNETQRAAIIDAYWSALSDSQKFDWTSPDAFQKELIASRLLLAMQMLCRPSDWSPPDAHRQNWLVDAEHMAQLFHQVRP